MLAAWLYAWRDTFAYAASVFTADTYRTNLYVLLAGLALCLYRARSRFTAPSLGFSPALRRLPLILIVLSLAANVLFVRLLDIHLFAAVAFGTGSYGLLGLCLLPREWRRGAAAAIMLVLALPFGEQADTYVGFTARVFTANAVQHLFTQLGIETMSASAVLATESGIAYVDVPCSGVKSLWTGAVFFLVATQLEGVRLGARWLLAAFVFAGALLAANVARVFTIVLLASVLEQARFADVLHEPLGVIGFAIACAAGYLLLRLLGQKDSCPKDHDQDAPKTGLPRALKILAAATCASGIFAVEPARAVQTSEAAAKIELAFQHTELELSPQEAAFLGRVGGSEARKIRFQRESLSGTALFVETRRFRAHHPPEICLSASGARIDSIEELSFGRDRAARRLSIDGGTRTALYFYQSGERTTGDIVERIWLDVFQRNDRWVLVSILIDRPVDAGDPALAELYESFRQGALR